MLLIAQLTHYLNLIYRADRVCVCVCVRDTRARFLLRRPQTRCGCWGHRGSGYSGVDVARLAVDRVIRPFPLFPSRTTAIF